MFDARQFIRDKRDGARHAPGAVRDFTAAFTRGDIPDYQVSAWLMAAFLKGLSDEEAFELTEAMLHSGAVIRFDGLPGPTVDKHSTGGVGDKISLPLAPLVAACGAFVPMISGRGLGHTGGTLDKLESIPGFSPFLSVADFKRLVASEGFAFGAQTAELAPADGKLYALRDVTATVECIPLIIASILSKKYASGTDAVVFDVKTGRGAFMRERADARKLAEGLIAVSRQLGKRASALITNMDQPLGRAIGNALEVKESIDILRGQGPADVRELTLSLAAEMLVLAGLASDAASGQARAEEALASGAALEKFRVIVSAQGGDSSVVDDPAKLKAAPHVAPVPAPRGGFVHAIDAYAVGELVVHLGGGRARKEDTIDPAVGVVLNKKVGDGVKAGEPLAHLHLREPLTPDLERALAGAYRIEPGAAPNAELVLERLGVIRLDEVLAILARTPRVLDAQLRGLPEAWTEANEGEDTWNARNVLGHLINGEDHDWIPRARLIVEGGGTFAPFSRFDHLANRIPVDELLDTFAAKRATNLETLRSWSLGPGELALTGTHPDFGAVTLDQLLATWVAHDLDHLNQVARVMAKRYDVAVGPWKMYLSVLKDRTKET